MKYFFACLIIPTGLVLIIAVFGFGALCFGVADLMERRELATNSSRPGVDIDDVSLDSFGRDRD